MFCLLHFFRLQTYSQDLSYWVDCLPLNEVHDFNKQFPAVTTVERLENAYPSKTHPQLLSKVTVTEGIK